MLAHSVRLLLRARKRGRPVFVVEHLPEGIEAGKVRAEIAGHGFVPLIARRDLSGEAWSERKATAAVKKGRHPPPAIPKEEPTGSPPTAPPTIPETWSDAEIRAAQQTCSQLLAALDVKMEHQPPIRSGSCGTAAPIRLHRVAGVEVRPTAVVNCPLAAAPYDRLVSVVQPAARDQLGSPLARVSKVSSYHCRNVNGGRSGSLGEHAFANAFDVADFTTAAGQTVRVRQHWGATHRDNVTAQATEQATGAASTKDPVPPDLAAPQRQIVRQTAARASTSRRPRGGRHFAALSEAAPRPASDAVASLQTAETTFLERAHAGACGIFGTVLGPEANEAHRDHCHLDLADRRTRPLCE
jgi:hypothetical protein